MDVEFCFDMLSMQYFPEHPAIPAARYNVQRLTPQPQALQTQCRQPYPPTRRGI